MTIETCARPVLFLVLDRRIKDVSTNPVDQTKIEAWWQSDSLMEAPWLRLTLVSGSELFLFLTGFLDSLILSRFKS